MTEITFKTRKGLFYSVEARGHAMYNEDGPDLLCCAISVLMQATINSIKKRVGNTTFVEHIDNEDECVMRITVHSNAYICDVRVMTLFDTLYDALEDLQYQVEYEDYMHIEVVEDDD